ncbi:MAG: ATP phosphoribosyltransferase regulatory subunit [Rhizobiaceae bacterium]
MNTRYPAIAPAILVLMSAREVEHADIPVLQPADPFLDTAGEELRSRIFLTQNEKGESLCLRPEFTIPVCRKHIAGGNGAHKRYGYLGEVFRQRRRGSTEFFQTGIEDLGDADKAAADARSLGDALAVLRVALPDREMDAVVGDQAIFEAVMSALGLAAGWRRRLARSFGSRAALESALHDLEKPHGGLRHEPPVSGLIAAEDDTGLAAHIAARMTEAGMNPKEGRTALEIARRLIDKAKLVETRLPSGAMKALRTFLAIKVPLDGAAAALRTFAAENDIDIDEAVRLFAARVGAISAQNTSGAELRYDAAFGRPLDYYTGHVFEIFAKGARQPLAGGGRYDTLLTLLGASEPIPGVGFSVWLDRVEAIAGDGS